MIEHEKSYYLYILKFIFLIKLKRPVNQWRPLASIVFVHRATTAPHATHLLTIAYPIRVRRMVFAFRTELAINVFVTVVGQVPSNSHILIYFIF